MRTLSKLLAASAFSGAIAAAMIATPAAAQMHNRNGAVVHQTMRSSGNHWRSSGHWRGDRDRGGLSFGFYGYPYYTSYPYYAPYAYYDCDDPNSPYFDTDYCDY